MAVHSLWVLLSRDYAGVSRALDTLPVSVPGSVRLRYMIFEGQGSIDEVIQWLAIAALVFAIVGVVPRVACLVAALALYHLAPLETVMWTPAPYARGMTLAPIALTLMAFSRSGDALVLFGSQRAGGPSWEYRWPIRIVQVLVTQIYFFSGVGKLLETGLEWGSPENVRQWLLWFSLSVESSVFSSLGLWIADEPVLCAMIGVGTLLFEMTFPLVLFIRGWTVVFVTIAVLFHVGTLFSMNIYVGEVWYLVAFIEWSGLSFARRHFENPVSVADPA